MKSKRAIILMVMGFVIMTVPFFIRMRDRNQAEHYIEQMGGIQDDTEGEEDIKTGNGEKAASCGVPEGAIGILEIENLHIRYPVFEGAGNEQLNIGIGHLTETAGLLEPGNCVLAGHNGSRRGAFFTNLSGIEIGTKVTVTNKNMVTHTYEVADTAIVGPYDASVCEKSGEECLTLITCAYHGAQRFVCRCRVINF